ncbi:hypothetical protein GCM10023067_22350 [Aminobacter aganoensis]
MRTVPREAGRQVRRYVANVLGRWQTAGRGALPEPLARSGDAPISRRAITASIQKLGASRGTGNVTRGYMSLLRGLERLNPGNKKAGSKKIRLSLFGSAD